MKEGHDYINEMLTEKGARAWSIDDLVASIGKNLSVDEHGNVTLEAGQYTIGQLEAIVICAANERGTMRLS
jgi:hypothetical protein